MLSAQDIPPPPFWSFLKTVVTTFQAFPLQVRLIEYTRIWDEKVECCGKGESKTKMTMQYNTMNTSGAISAAA